MCVWGGVCVCVNGPRQEGRVGNTQGKYSVCVCVGRNVCVCVCMVWKGEGGELWGRGGDWEGNNQSSQAGPWSHKWCRQVVKYSPKVNRE